MFQCYKIFGSTEDERVTWHAARTACMNLGGNLATIPNEQVQGTANSSVAPR